MTNAGITVVPAHCASWDDLRSVFGERGQAQRCWCQRYKLQPRESFASFPADERAHRMRQQTDCGNPGAERTSGLVAYLADQAVGWCAVEPRSEYDGLVRNQRVPWTDREEDRSDPHVWALTCLFTRAGFRRRGVSRAMVAAAVEHAQRNGAAALEAYPVTTTEVIAEELHVGIERVFAAAGFGVITRPTSRRVVMRIEFCLST
jgi:GNAT superfamily N-acetyltransferase